MPFMLSSLLRQINVLKSADALLAKKNKLLCEKLGAYHSSYAGVTNGGFETGNLTGWIVANEGCCNVWSAYSGTLSPVSGITFAAPPQGVYAATSYFIPTGPGSHIMYQDLVLKKFQSHNLTFILYYDNSRTGLLIPPGEFCTPDTLDYKMETQCNQQYRVDVMDPAAPVDSVASGDVLATLFRTEVGAPPTLAPTPMAFDLSAFAGRTVRLRFSQVDNRGFFLAFVDAVNLQSTC